MTLMPKALANSTCDNPANFCNAVTSAPESILPEANVLLSFPDIALLKSSSGKALSGFYPVKVSRFTLAKIESLMKNDVASHSVQPDMLSVKVRVQANVPDIESPKWATVSTPQFQGEKLPKKQEYPAPGFALSITTSSSVRRTPSTPADRNSNF